VVLGNHPISVGLTATDAWKRRKQGTLIRLATVQKRKKPAKAKSMRNVAADRHNWEFCQSVSDSRHPWLP
jgi:hypothetical protein